MGALVKRDRKTEQHHVFISLSPGWLTRCCRHESESQAICSSIQFFVYCSKELDQRHEQKRKEGQFKKEKTLQKM